MPFGQYQGKTLGWLYKNDAPYLLWAREKLTAFDIGKQIAEFIHQKNLEIINRDTSGKK